MRPSILHFATLLVVGFLTPGTVTIGRSQPRLLRDFRSRPDSLRQKGVPHQLLVEERKHYGYESTRIPHRKVLSPQSQTYVIDTAIVRSTSDTTRHLYSFNASGKRTCDLTQKLAGELWVDS